MPDAVFPPRLHDWTSPAKYGAKCAGPASVPGLGLTDAVVGATGRTVSKIGKWFEIRSNPSWSYQSEFGSVAHNMSSIAQKPVKRLDSNVGERFEQFWSRSYRQAPLVSLRQCDRLRKRWRMSTPTFAITNVSSGWSTGAARRKWPDRRRQLMNGVL